MNKKGFTLLECMIAIGIFAIISVVCLQMYIMEIKKVKIMNEKQIFLQLAQSKIEQLLIENKKIEEGEGEFESPFTDYRWEITLSDTTFNDTEEDIEITPFILKVHYNDETFSYYIPVRKLEKYYRRKRKF